MSFFNKISDVLIVDTFKQNSRRYIDIEVFASDTRQVGAFQQNMNNGKWQIA